MEVNGTAGKQGNQGKGKGGRRNRKNSQVKTNNHNNHSPNQKGQINNNKNNKGSQPTSTTNTIRNKIIVRLEQELSDSLNSDEAVVEQHTYRLVSGYTFAQLLGDCKRHWAEEIGCEADELDGGRVEFQDAEGCTWPLAGVIENELTESDYVTIEQPTATTAKSECAEKVEQKDIKGEEDKKPQNRIKLPSVRLIHRSPIASRTLNPPPSLNGNVNRIAKEVQSASAIRSGATSSLASHCSTTPSSSEAKRPAVLTSRRSLLRKQVISKVAISATTLTPPSPTTTTTTTTTTSGARETATASTRKDTTTTVEATLAAPKSPEISPRRKKSGIRLVKSNSELCEYDSFDNAEITLKHPLQETRLLWHVRPKRVLLIKKPNDAEITSHLNDVAKWLIEEQEMEVLVEPGLEAELPHLKPFNLHEETLLEQVDFIVTLGGDGTILYVNSLFSAAIPPILSFNLGSLGFLTPFHFSEYREAIENVINGSFYLTLRQRIQAQIFRADENAINFEAQAPYHCMNEVVIDRGPGSYLCSLECYCDNILITTLQADGIIVSTTTGSTAYSLSAGGTMVHPIVEGICFTPICPHSLSCRPIMFPGSVTLKIRVPEIARGSAWVSYDGRTRYELRRHDYILLKPSKWPVPCINKTDHIGDWFKSLCECLNWNDRRAQKAFPMEGLPAKEKKTPRMVRASSFSLNT